MSNSLIQLFTENGQQKGLLIEHVAFRANHFGFYIKWKISNSWADFWVYEVVAKNCDPPHEFYFATDKSEQTGDYEKAESFLEGYTKIDGCSEISLSLHFCDVSCEGYTRLKEVLDYISKKAFLLMKEMP